MKKYFQIPNKKAGIIWISAVALALSFSHCTQDDNSAIIDTVKGESTIKISVSDIINSGNEEITRSQEKQIFTADNDGVELEAIVEADPQATTRAIPLETGRTFRLIIFKQDGTIAKYKDYVAGTPSYESITVPAGQYYVTAYSYNNSTPIQESAPTSASFTPLQTNDLLYFNSGLVSFANGTDNSVHITFSHLYSRAKIVIDASFFRRTISAAQGVITPNFNGTSLNLLTGALSGGASGPKNLTWTTSNAQVSTSSEVHVNARGTEGVNLTFSHIKLQDNNSHKQYIDLYNKAISFPEKALRPGKTYTITVKFKISPSSGIYDFSSGLIWAPGNLIQPKAKGKNHYSFYPNQDDMKGENATWSLFLGWQGNDRTGEFWRWGKEYASWYNELGNQEYDYKDPCRYVGSAQANGIWYTPSHNEFLNLLYKKNKRKNYTINNSVNKRLIAGTVTDHQVILPKAGRAGRPFFDILPDYFLGDFIPSTGSHHQPSGCNTIGYYWTRTNTSLLEVDLGAFGGIEFIQTAAALRIDNNSVEIYGGDLFGNSVFNPSIDFGHTIRCVRVVN